MFVLCSPYLFSSCNSPSILQCADMCPGELEEAKNITARKGQIHCFMDLEGLKQLSIHLLMDVYIFYCLLT